ncbi:MAG TPA: alpha/beta fold hydrolase [Gaiellaceae bacterium]|jgi:pimeloyl-ACP methyl ester carboxylesterase
MDYVAAGEGPPVFYFHGGGDAPSSRPVETFDARVISVARCGPAVPGRTLRSWAADVVALADELGLGRFGVIGWSAGGPHALAVAAFAPDRVDRVSLVASMPPHDVVSMVRRDVHVSVMTAKRSLRLATAMLESWGRRPTAALPDPAHSAAYARGRVESFTSGGRWLAQELAYLGRPWGFELSDVRAPVTIWWGDRDTICPPSIAHEYERRLPSATLKLVADGHSILFSRWREILADATPQTRP